MRVPPKFHFITGLHEDFGGKPFSFIHAMAIRSALALHPDFKATVYFTYEPSGPDWDSVKDLVTCAAIVAPSEIFGRQIAHFAHKTDVLRLQILLEHGGIYLDLDSICQKSFASLLDGQVVMGWEEKSDGTKVGLCNAVIVAPPGAEFLRLWLDSFREFDPELWNNHAVIVPMRIARTRPELVAVEPKTSFFWPSWDEHGIQMMFVEDHSFEEAFCFHLWESRSWDFVSGLTRDEVLHTDTSYNRIARRFVESDQPAGQAAADAQPQDTADAELKKTFDAIYRDKTWGEGSGSGSTFQNNLRYIAFVSEFLLSNRIKSVVDFGCGYWQFARFIDWTGVDYTGIDIVHDVIHSNRLGFGQAANIKFQHFTSLSQLPRADLLLCKDVFAHLSIDRIRAYLTRFKELFKFILVTNDTYPDHLLNTDIPDGGWRALRFDIAPFDEDGAIVLSWPVISGGHTVQKSTTLFINSSR